MIPRPITDPVPGERIAAVVPRPRPAVDDAGWRRRLNYFTGRSLSDVALRLEQDWRAGHLAEAGTTVSHGVVTGLEVGLEASEDGFVIDIGAGHGITAWGEDVVIPRALRIPLEDLWVYRPAGQEAVEMPRPLPEVGSRLRPRLPGAPAEPRRIPAGTRPAETGTLPPPTLSPTLPLRPPPPGPMELSAPLRAMREAKVPVSRVMILLLEPTVSEVYGALDTGDPCERDPAAEAFGDWQLVDGCRLVLYSWPWPSPQWIGPEGPTRRNELANTIFSLEERHAPGELHPWERVGVPLALIDLGRADGPVPAGAGPGALAVQPFVDSHAVLRDGGRPRRRSALVDGVGNPFLWQARLQQFAEQLAEVDWRTADPQGVFRRIRYYPPAGLLPRNAVEVTLGRLVTSVFPPFFALDAVPVPLEQMEAVLEASAGLERFDASRADRLRLLVPVPQALYEPRLLHEEAVSDEFQQAIDAFSARRWSWLVRRESVRRRAEALVHAVEGSATSFPDPRRDPARLEEEMPPGELPWPGMHAHLSIVSEERHQHYFRSASPTMPVSQGDVLFGSVYLDPENVPEQVMLQWNDGSWAHRAYWGEDRIDWGQNDTVSRRRIGDLPEAGEWLRLEVPAGEVGLEGREVNGIAWTLFGGRAAWGPAGRMVTDPATGEQREDSWVLDALPPGAVPTDAEDGWTWLPVDHDFELPPEEREAELGTAPRAWEPREVLAVTRLRDRLTTSPLRPEELAELDARGLAGFMEFLEARVRAADDRVDFGFLRVQSDMYRLRKLMLGEEKATRLATSPALADIIKSDSAVSVREGLLDYMNRLKLPLTAKAAPVEGEAEGGIDPAATRTGRSFTEELSRFSERTSTTVRTEARFAVAAQPETISKVGATTFGTFSALTTAPLQVETVARAAPTAALTPTQAARATSTISAVSFGAAAALPRDVLLRSPIVGESFDFRNVTVGERLSMPAPNEARSFTVATKYETVKALATLEINLSDLLVSGLIKVADDGTVELHANTGLPVRQSRTFAELHPAAVVEAEGDAAEASLLEKLILGEPSPQDGDEAAFFSAGIDILDSTIATLRNVEGRVQEYRYALEKCAETQAEIRALAADADRRLMTIEEELSEARHDVAVARALLADEERRVEGVNERRRLILRDHVRFLAYHRPRESHGYLDAPVRRIDPAIVPSAVPDCLAAGIDPRPELRGMVELLREAPLRWFERSKELLAGLDSLEVLLGTVRNARGRAERVAAPGTFEQPTVAGRGLLAAGLGRAFAAQQRVVLKHRGEAARLDLSRMPELSWKRARALAEQHLSLGDLIDASHGRTDVDRGAAGELDDILRIASCLYARFGDVTPRVRLDWAERLGQYDEAVNLRNLYSLPRWGEVDYLDRREMQSLVDWLYGRVDAREPEAVAMISDVVRVCLLLASHAPVNQLLSGSIARQTSGRVGEVIELTVDPARVRVGMPVLVYDQRNRPVQAVVEDLAGGLAISRVLQAAEATFTIAKGARAQLGGALPGTSRGLPFGGGGRR